jgi:hypothetical protein
MRINSKDVLTPELRKHLPSHLLLDVSHDLRRDSRVNPCETMNVGTATALELVPEPRVENAELRLKDDLKEGSGPLVEVPGRDVRIVLEIAPANLVPLKSY